MKLHPSTTRNFGVAIFGSSLALLISLPGTVGATESQVGFKVKAQDTVAPEIQAVAGSVAETTAVEQPVDSGSSVHTLSCGAETLTVTEAMLDWSAENRTRLGRGQEPKPWPGSEWSFIHESGLRDGSGSGAQSIVFSSSPSTGDSAHLNIGGAKVPLEPVALKDLTSGKLLGTIESGGQVPAASGSVSSMVIQRTSIQDGEIESCSYSRFEDGKLDSPNTSSPAYFMESSSDYAGTQATSETSLYARAGDPLFGADRPSYRTTTRDGSGAEVYGLDIYYGSAGSSWDYYRAKAVSWHPDRAVTRIPGAADTTTRWISCFPEDCSNRFSNPVVEVSPQAFDPALVALGLDGYKGSTLEYLAPTPAPGGYDRIRSSTTSTGATVKSWLRGESPLLSRKDGPAIYELSKDGKSFRALYYIDGKRYDSEASFRAAGGSGWMGLS